MKPVPKPSRALTATIRGLREGYGVEDIAVMHGFTIEAIRKAVADLRARDVLRAILSQGRKEARK